MYLAVADCKWNTRFQPIAHFDQYSGTKNQLKAKFTGQTKGLLKKFRPQCGFKQNLGSMTGPRWASCTELEFAYNRKKKLPLKTVEMWDRGGNGPGAEKRLPLSYLCIFGREIKYTHRNLAWLPKIDPLFSCWFLFQGGKGNLRLFSKQGNFSCIKKKKVTKNLVYRLERRLDFLKTVEIFTHRALLQILLSGNYNGCCQNQICLTG